MLMELRVSESWSNSSSTIEFGFSPYYNNIISSCAGDDYYYWEMVETLRKCALVGVIVFVDRGSHSPGNNLFDLSHHRIGS